MTRGKFITFEGTDSSGKSTQAELLHSDLQQRGHAVITTREPGGTDIGEAIRKLVVYPTQRLNGLTETLLMFAARREHIIHKIEPALAAGTWVICDRFTDSTYAYQGGGRGVDTKIIDQLAHWVQDALTPDITFYLNFPPASSSYPLFSEEIFEKEDAVFYERIAKVYQQLANREPQRVINIMNEKKEDGSRRARDEIQTDIQQAINRYLLPKT